MPVLRIAHDANGGPGASNREEGGQQKPATCPDVQPRREKRAARKELTQARVGGMLRVALGVCEVSHDQFAQRVGLADTGIDEIVAGRKPLHLDDLLTDSNDVRRVGLVLLAQVAAAIDGGRQASNLSPEERLHKASAEAGDVHRAMLDLARNATPQKRAQLAREAQEASDEYAALARAVLSTST